MYVCLLLIKQNHKLSFTFVGKQDFLGVVWQSQPGWRLAVTERFDPVKELVSPDAVRHCDLAILAWREKTWEEGI